MTSILLTGAGFSHNWGGWLSNEAFEYLSSCRDVDQQLREELWEDHNKPGGGFEATLGRLQSEPKKSQALKNLESAIAGMFSAMNEGLIRAPFDGADDAKGFLSRFDAIFTLNQDLLIEQAYVTSNISLLRAHRQWVGAVLPGIRALVPPPIIGTEPDYFSATMVPVEPLEKKLSPDMQPYVKLHGSLNWRTSEGGSLLIMGGNKARSLAVEPLLVWYQELFREYLMRPDARLMTIGYSFGDEHINKAICDGAASGHLGIFIVDPRGVDVLDKRDLRAQITDKPLDLLNGTSPHIICASRRPLRATLATDKVERAKLLSFFQR